MPAAYRYPQIVEEIRSRITSGRLRPGDRVPSIRQLAQHYDVAVATATRAMAALRDEGLVESRVGSGTVVSARPADRAGARGSWPVERRPLNRDHVLFTAISIADSEGLDAVSMRRLAADLQTGPMALYRHVSGKDDLVKQMADEVFGTQPPPEPGPDGWRAKLELISRMQWDLCQRHLWLPRVISFTRPLMMPNAVAHTEWTLRAIDGLGLSPETMIREAITLAAYVMTVATTLAAEVEATYESGWAFDRWWREQEGASNALAARFPMLANLSTEAAMDLQELFEYGLARHLDGFAHLVDHDPPLTAHAERDP